ncbi:hypothetical protein D3C72_2343450 [compost metagenome]
MPEKPFTSALTRKSTIARATGVGNGAPTPAAWLTIKLRWRVSTSSIEILRSFMNPKPVVMP